MQLLTVAIPPLERLSRDGELGRKKITAITRYLTVGLGLLQGTGYYFYLRASNFEGTNVVKYAEGGAQFCSNRNYPDIYRRNCVADVLGEQINKRGVGNGISIILFAGIVANMPTLFTHLVNYFIDACKYRCKLEIFHLGTNIPTDFLRITMGDFFHERRRAQNSNSIRKT